MVALLSVGRMAFQNLDLLATIGKATPMSPYQVITDQEKLRIEETLVYGLQHETNVRLRKIIGMSTANWASHCHERKRQ
jgi:hypothetical protein